MSTALLPMAAAAAALSAPTDAQASHSAICDAELNIVDADWARELTTALGRSTCHRGAERTYEAAYLAPDDATFRF